MEKLVRFIELYFKVWLPSQIEITFDGEELNSFQDLVDKTNIDWRDLQHIPICVKDVKTAENYEFPIRDPYHFNQALGDIIEDGVYRYQFVNGKRVAKI